MPFSPSRNRLFPLFPERLGSKFPLMIFNCSSKCFFTSTWDKVKSYVKK